MLRISEDLQTINSPNQTKNIDQCDIDRWIHELNRHGHASSVAHVLHQHIQGASENGLIPLLRCVVKSVVKMQGDLFACFEHGLPHVMEDVFKYLYKKEATKTMSELKTLRRHWKNIFSCETLNDMDKRFGSFDSSWPTFTPGKRLIKPSVPGKFQLLLPPMSQVGRDSDDEAEQVESHDGGEATVVTPFVPACSPSSQSSFDDPLPTRSSSHKPPTTQFPRLATNSKQSSLSSTKPSSSLGPLRSSKPAPRGTTGKDRSVRSSSSVRFQPLEYFIPSKSRRSTTETKLRRSRIGSNSDKENEGIERHR